MDMYMYMYSTLFIFTSKLYNYIYTARWIEAFNLFRNSQFGETEKVQFLQVDLQKRKQGVIWQKNWDTHAP